MRCRLQRERTGRRGTKDALQGQEDPAQDRVPAHRQAEGARRRSAHRPREDKPLALAHGAYQKIISCYAHEDRRKGRGMMAELIESLAVKSGAPGCPELATLGRTLKRRMGDVFAFFDHPNGANGPTEAINGRLETLRDIAPASATSTTTSPEACCTPAASDTPSKPTSDTCPYTPKSEEPDNLLYDEDATYSAFRPYQQN